MEPVMQKLMKVSQGREKNTARTEKTVPVCGWLVLRVQNMLKN